MNKLIKIIAVPFFISIALLMMTACDDIAGSKTAYDDGISSNARLANLIVSDGELNYPFNPYDWVYETSVPYEVESITVTAMAEHLRATMSINGEPADSGSASEPISLEVGENVVTVMVTAWDGTDNIYT
ncbi:MAG TPA: cadherin-like beta sandwich domain-containing protein, partial [Spirochaetota bacterium]|nr:cadherin-like beta sandwich domain-containing protein [Spirochaetota bacterium]